MKRMIVSRSHLNIFLRGIWMIPLFVWVGHLSHWRYLEHTIMFMALVALVLFNILYFSGAIFYIGENGVGMRILLFKKRIIPWEEIKAYGVFRTRNIDVVYFAKRNVPWNLCQEINAKPRLKEMEWLAFAEFDKHFMKNAAPYLPAEMADFLKERARQGGFEE